MNQTELMVETPSGDPPPPPSRRRGVLVALGAAIVALAVGIVVALATRSDHHSATSLVLPPKQSAVSAGARELISLLDTGRHTTFHATYRAIGDPKSLGGQLTFEVWQFPPRVREDTALTNGTKVVRTASFVDGRTGHGCSQTDQQTWVCHQAPVGSGRGPQGLLSTIGNDVSSRPVAVSDDTVAGRKVRCFTVAADTGSVELCATSAGIPVLIANKAVRLELVTLSTSVPSSEFTTPAPDSK